MSRSTVSLRSFAWSRVALLALIGTTVASCSNSNRFDSTPYYGSRSAPSQEYTGSIGSRPATVRLDTQPEPSRPATVAAYGGSYGVASGGAYGVANGAQGLGAYRPAATTAEPAPRYSEVTGSIPERAPPKPSGHWTWDGGAPVTVGYGETVETIARWHNVPVAAIVETNGFRYASEIKPGQRLVIPRYVTIGSAATQAQASAPVRQSYARPLPAPRLSQPRTVTTDRYAGGPPQAARMATQEPAASDTVAKTAEPAGGVPSFRWPVRGKIITAFGANANGAQNDGINLAVPEGTPIKAADDGIVAYAGNELKGYGNLVLVRHSNGFVSAYAHASEILVKRGDSVKRGQVIANAGQTGNVTSPQLHFEIRNGSTPVDPMKYLGGA